MSKVMLTVILSPLTEVGVTVKFFINEYWDETELAANGLNNKTSKKEIVILLKATTVKTSPLACFFSPTIG